MSKPQVDEKVIDKHQTKEGQELKGTLMSVLLLGAFIAVTWIGVWILFTIR